MIRKTAPELDTNVTWMPLSSLDVDHAVNTRFVDQKWVATTAKDFNPDSVGVITVSDRGRSATPRYVILDGQNRAALVEKVLGPGQMIEARVLTGLSHQQEAALFTRLNAGRSVKALFTFLANVTAGDPVATEINATAERAGWQVGDSRAQVRAPEALIRVHRLGGIKAVADTLTVINAAWNGAEQRDPDSVTAPILGGIGQVVAAHPDIDLDSLALALSRRYTPSALRGAGRSRRESLGGSLAHGVAFEVVAVYNRSRRSGRLPVWA